MAGRAVLCPPSGIGRGINVALPSCGGQRTARPATDGWRIAPSVPSTLLSSSAAGAFAAANSKGWAEGAAGLAEGRAAAAARATGLSFGNLFTLRKL
jgi:hypothetical protein